MVRGEDEVIMCGEMVPVRAEIAELDNASAHADANELLARLSATETVFITRGDAVSANTIKKNIEEKLH